MDDNHLRLYYRLDTESGPERWINYLALLMFKLCYRSLT